MTTDDHGKPAQQSRLWWKANWWEDVNDVRYIKFREWTGWLSDLNHNARGMIFAEHCEPEQPNKAYAIDKPQPMNEVQFGYC